MNADAQPLDGIHELNLSYLLLAQQLLREDKAVGMFRLGVSAEIAEILVSLSPAQIAKLAAARQLLCAFRFKDDAILSALTHTAKRAAVVPAHAALVLAGQPAEAFA
jgi:flagellar transcriptional activator FlhD